MLLGQTEVRGKYWQWIENGGQAVKSYLRMLYIHIYFIPTNSDEQVNNTNYIVTKQNFVKLLTKLDFMTMEQLPIHQIMLLWTIWGEIVVAVSSSGVNGKPSIVVPSLGAQSVHLFKYANYFQCLVVYWLFDS